MFHIVILCGPDGSGKRNVLDSVRKALSTKNFGNAVRVNRKPIHLLSSDDGVKIGLAKKLTESEINSLIADSRGIEVLVCSTRTDKDAWRYCDLIQSAHGEYVVLLKRKEPQKDRKRIGELLCRQIIACSHAFASR